MHLPFRESDASSGVRDCIRDLVFRSNSECSQVQAWIPDWNDLPIALVAGQSCVIHSTTMVWQSSNTDRSSSFVARPLLPVCIDLLSHGLRASYSIPETCTFLSCPPERHQYSCTTIFDKSRHVKLGNLQKQWSPGNLALTLLQLSIRKESMLDRTFDESVGKISFVHQDARERKVYRRKPPNRWTEMVY